MRLFHLLVNIGSRKYTSGNIGTLDVSLNICRFDYNNLIHKMVIQLNL